MRLVRRVDPSGDVSRRGPWLVLGVARPGVDELAAVRDERAQHVQERIGAVLRDLLDDLARAQADDGQHLARARNGSVRNAAVLERRKTAVSQTAFEFISTTTKIGEVRVFMRALPEVLAR